MLRGPWGTGRCNAVYSIARPDGHLHILRSQYSSNSVYSGIVTDSRISYHRASPDQRGGKNRGIRKQFLDPETSAVSQKSPRSCTHRPLTLCISSWQSTFYGFFPTTPYLLLMHAFFAVDVMILQSSDSSSHVDVRFSSPSLLLALSSYS
ncbi:hypothetical protein L228DRAFT_120301 [Xylona heveae TC161]|uniref:Uncharacterized protein n=1 Tax=Xylona heveae (strain CBS 132557 / TC161) TaxID=1328760 RepID=A0A165HJ21_XYLHT|nr:hypothetical protein L228DRAFT_120301 [Xylona heveae TC161]KZF23592.1 hypothetical protein L228DRAFT_120301 [Xylona heveae TC161]